MINACFHKALLTFAFLFSISATAEPFSQLIIFSGSLSDTGNIASIQGDFPSPFFMNRSTNGPAAVDILASRLGLSAEPSLHLIGMDAGTNYAVLGALASNNRSIDLPAQIEAYLAPRGNVADPDALFFVFIGGNDVITAAIEPDDQVADRIIRDAISGIRHAIRRLVNAGAKTLFVPNFIDLGIAPVARDTGLADRATEQSKKFNRTLERMLDRVERKLGLKIIRFDFFKFGEDVLASADKLGFTNTTDSCLALLDSEECDFDSFVFFNELFPSAKVHELLGTALTFALIEQLNPSKCQPRWSMDSRHGRFLSSCAARWKNGEEPEL